MADKAGEKRALIGWREWVGFPDFRIERMNAKIDTGARFSAIHACRIRSIDIDGDPFVEFFAYPVQGKKTPEVFCVAPLVGRRVIRSSNGYEEERIVVEARMRLGADIWSIDLTLTNRDEMEYRLLVGRDALQKKFIVDPGASYLVSV